MALKDGARIKETSVTSGSGSLSLGGAVLGHQAILDVLATTDTFKYWILDANGLGWEYGLGTITAGAPNTLSRDTIYGSSNGGAAISLSIATGSNTHFIFSAPMPGRVTGDVDYEGALLHNPTVKSYGEVLQTPSSVAGVLTLYLSLGNNFHVVMTEAITSIVISNPKPTGVSQNFTLKLEQGGAGSYALTLPASVKFDGGTAPTLVTAVGEYDRLGFISEDGGTQWDMIHAGGAFA